MDIPALPPGYTLTLVDEATKLFPEPTMDALSATIVSAKGTLDVRDYGAVSDPATDNTAAIVAAIAAAEPHGATVLFPAGDYRCDGEIVVPDYVILEGAGSFSRYGTQLGGGASYGWRKATVRIYRLSGVSTSPLIRLEGSGSGIRNIQLEGANAPGTILVTEGFETVLENVRIINGTGIGLDVEKANNTKWSNIFVDNCGSATLPGVRIWSKDGAGSANETNTLDINGLTIERCANVHLDIAYNPADLTDTEYWAEWVRISNLHIESSSQNIGVGANEGNTDPVVRIGNVRSVDLVSPFIYGGPGYLILHDQQYNRSYGNGGIKIKGGQLLGSDIATGVDATPSLVHLVNGTGFILDGVQTNRATGNTIIVESTYGSEVKISPTCFPAPSVTDGRTAPTVQRIQGALDVIGHVESWAASPSVAGVSSITPSLQADATDQKGTIKFSTGASPAGGSGVICTVTFAKAWDRFPSVQLTAEVPAMDLIGISATVTKTVMTIRSSTGLAASQPMGTYGLHYRVS